MIFCSDKANSEMFDAAKNLKLIVHLYLYTEIKALGMEPDTSLSRPASQLSRKKLLDNSDGTCAQNTSVSSRLLAKRETSTTPSVSSVDCSRCSLRSLIPRYMHHAMELMKEMRQAQFR